MQLPPDSWHFLVNPHAGGGRARQVWRKMLPQLKALLPEMSFSVTTAVSTLKDLTEEALRAGKTTLIGVGGDGTHHHILNAIVNAGSIHHVTYGAIPLGSGNDWYRSINGLDVRAYLSNPQQALNIRSQMLGQVNLPEKSETHYFLNVMGMAYDAEVVRMASQLKKKSGWMYLKIALGHLRQYVAPVVELNFGGKEFTGPVHTINVGIGKYSGGGMQFVPQADPFGTKLALTYVKELPPLKVMLNSYRFYTGSIAQVEGVTCTHTDSLIVTEESGTLEIEADGEWLGAGTAIVSIYAARLRVLCS